MVFNPICRECNTTVGHLYIPFMKLMEEKKIKGGDMSDNRDICEKLKIAKYCCRMQLLCDVPDDHFKHIRNKLIKDKISKE